MFGVSTQAHEAQAHYAEIARIKHLLLSDPHLSLAAALGLRTSSPGGNASFYARALLIAPPDAEPVLLNVVAPGEYPASALAWLRERAS
jgi:peroxiredoxin